MSKIRQRITNHEYTRYGNELDNIWAKLREQGILSEQHITLKFRPNPLTQCIGLYDIQTRTILRYLFSIYLKQHINGLNQQHAIRDTASHCNTLQHMYSRSSTTFTNKKRALRANESLTHHPAPFAT